MVEPCPPDHLAAMRAATERIRQHAELAVHDTSCCAGHEEIAGRLREQVAAMTSSADYAASLQQQRTGEQLHERLERTLKGAIETAYRLGQVAAMPSLDDPAHARAPRYPVSPGPGDPGFDKWCLTDARSRPRWKRDPAAARSLDRLWAADPDPAATLAIQGQIDAALLEGRITYASDRTGRPLGHYMRCPFSAIYQAVLPVWIAGAPLRPGQQLTFDVSAEEVAKGGAFRRELLSAWFSLTDELDYCNPAEG